MTFATLAEQPRLSLEARRANHAFLTQPIARQALLVVAPEYNRFAPVLAKPVRPALAVADPRLGRRRGAPDRKPRRARGGDVGSGRRRRGSEPPPSFEIVALGDA